MTSKLQNPKAKMIILELCNTIYYFKKKNYFWIYAIWK